MKDIAVSSSVSSSRRMAMTAPRPTAQPIAAPPAASSRKDNPASAQEKAPASVAATAKR